MQFDSIAESSHRSFLQYYQAALGNHLSKALRYVYIFSLHLYYSKICVFFQDKIHETYSILVFSVPYYL